MTRASGDTREKPLVTLALFAFNQEKYIREAIEGVLAQIYSPLEIILSDDCSSDRTFDVMEEMAALYSGPHKLVVNRMATNSGLANHINHVFEMAKGELIVLAAGDDISLPLRASALIDCWLEGNKAAGVIYSDIDVIDANSRLQLKNAHVDFSQKKLEDFLANPFALICSYSVTKSLVNEFPNLNSDLVNEDFVFPLRALLSGRTVSYVNSSLVQYRVSDGIGHNNVKRSRKDFAVDFYREAALWRQIRADLSLVGMSPERLSYVNSRLKLATTKIDFCKLNFVKAIMLLLSMEMSAYRKCVFVFRVCFPRLYNALKRIKSQ